MGLKLASPEWVAALSEALNGSESYRQAAKEWEGDFVLVVEPDGEDEVSAYVYLDLYHGACRGHALLRHPDERPSAYTIAAPRSVWRRVVEGKLDPIQGMVMRQLRLRGDVMRIMRHPRAAREIVAVCMQVPTEF